MKRKTEHSEQAFIVEWAALMSKEVPELALLFAVPNGMPLLGADQRLRAVIINYMKREGMKKGVPDLWLPVPRGDYHGLVIENKLNTNKPTPEQAWWLDQLHQQGYLAVACWSADEVIQVIVEYLNLPNVNKAGPYLQNSHEV